MCQAALVATTCFYCAYLYGYYLLSEDDVLFSMKDRYMKFYLKEVFKQEKQLTWKNEDTIIQVLGRNGQSSADGTEISEGGGCGPV